MHCYPVIIILMLDLLSFSFMIMISDGDVIFVVWLTHQRPGMLPGTLTITSSRIS